jgi:hypothetical protein
VTQAFDWNLGVFLGSMMASETTAAAGGQVGKLPFEPMAMPSPFYDYNVADFLNHLLEICTDTDAKTRGPQTLRSVRKKAPDEMERVAQSTRRHDRTHELSPIYDPWRNTFHEF